MEPRSENRSILQEATTLEGATHISHYPGGRVVLAREIPYECDEPGCSGWIDDERAYACECKRPKGTLFESLGVASGKLAARARVNLRNLGAQVFGPLDVRAQR